MKEPRESPKVEEEEAPKVETVDYSKLEIVDLSKPQYPFELAQSVGGSSATQKIYQCHAEVTASARLGMTRWPVGLGARRRPYEGTSKRKA